MVPASQGLPIVGVLGSGTDAHDELAEPLGRCLAELGVHLLTGGGGGVMAAVSRAFHGVEVRPGIVLGVLPCQEGDPRCNPRPGYPNPWVELPILTHLPLSGQAGTHPLSRNHINVLSSRALVALPGGAGTASEVRLAVAYRRPVIAFLHHRGQIVQLPAAVQATPELEEVASFLQRRLAIRDPATPTPPGSLPP